MTDQFSIEVFCGGVYQTNGYLVRFGDERAWLFDAPESVGNWLIEKDVKLEGLFLTHQHHDHILGAHQVQEHFGCPTWAWAEPSDELTLIKDLERRTNTSCNIKPYTIDHLLEGETTIPCQAFDLTLLHVPGHSPDSVCFLIEGKPILIGGDVLFSGSIGRTDLPNGDHDLLISGIKEKLWALPDHIRVLPGHGPPTVISQEKATNPFLVGE